VEHPLGLTWVVPATLTAATTQIATNASASLNRCGVDHPPQAVRPPQGGRTLEDLLRALWLEENWNFAVVHAALADVSGPSSRPLDATTTADDSGQGR
jgi:hypothetical protein